jgi:type I restriction enzyme S subunit
MKSSTRGLLDWLYRPPFPADWEKSDLYNLAIWLNGMAFRDFQFADAGKPIIKIAEIKNGITGQTKFTMSEYDPAYYIKPGDMLFAWSGQPDTSIDVYWWRGPEGWLNQHIFKVTPSPKCHPVFFYYLLKYLKPNFVAIARNKQTTGLGHVTVRDLSNMSVGIPDRRTQKAIAHILGTLDDKIELNRQMNATLEAIARALFQSWFVDLDPVRAKAEGRQPAGMDAETAALFPAAFVDSELGKIPKGWDVKTVGEVCEFAYGESLKEDKRRSGSVPVYGSNGQIGWHDQARVKGPGVVIGRKGNAGTVTWSQSEFFPIDTTFYVVPRGCISMYYLFHALSLLDLPSLGADSAVPGLNRNMAYQSKILVPDTRIVDAFDKQVSDITAKVALNDSESRTLAALRDALLPKLISGEIEVKAIAEPMETTK